MIRHLIFYFVASIIISTGCAGKNIQKTDHFYSSEIAQWKQKRLSDLQKHDGWPTLIGLYWLDEGVNTIGSNRNNSICFPKALPDVIGEIELKNGQVEYRNNPNVGVSINGVAEQSGYFQTDMEEETTYAYWKSFQWHIIKRGEKHAIRLKDTLHPARLALKDIPTYPLDKKWRKEATYVKAQNNAIVAMENQVDMTIPYKIDGYLSFQHKGKTHQLIALDGGPDILFVLISDKTTGVETYGGGRYMYISRPDETGVTFIDFNQAVNPPCVFTDFATCLLPPGENALPFKILAGEKMYENH